MNYKRLKNIVGWGVVVLIGYFFWRALSRNWERVQEINIGVTLEAIIATLLFALAVLVSGYLWGMVFARISGKHVSVKEATRAHIGAWILKYIPGQVGALLYKLQWGTRYGVSKKVTTVAFAYEMLFLTLASTVVIIPILLITSGDATGSSLLAIYLLAIAALVIFTRKRLNQAIILFLSRVSGKNITNRYVLALREITAFAGWFSIPRIINAVGFVILTVSLFDISSAAYVPLGAAYILAGIVGIYAIFVPSGLGVREAVIVAFASVFMSPEEAIVLSLLARFYATIADGLLALIYVYLKRSNDPNTNKPIEAETA
jgi:uncharacterized membrane protein YbhN (UPF0104 family)